MERNEAPAIYAPELELRRGTQEPHSELGHFSCLRDGAPDAWGRRFIHARRFGHAEMQPDDGPGEATYLMQSGSDRIGALDFQESASHYLPREADSASLEDLQKAVEWLSSDSAIPPNLKAALFHGSSIGGARPKAAVTGNSAKYIAKFSLSNDHHDVFRSEWVAMSLAAQCRLDVATVSLQEEMQRVFGPVVV